jgi:hypothetical protein
MRKRRSSQPIPPLSRQALGEVELIEEDVQDLLANCGDNPEKALRILRTGVVELLDVQMDFYLPLPDFQIVWVVKAVRTTVDSMICLLPPFTFGEQFRGDLFFTAIHHVTQRLRGATNAVATAAPPKPAPVPSETASTFQQDSTPSVQKPAGRSVNASDNEEITRRSKLLTEYKAATKNPSNKRIYGARNSGIHKPEFYEWVNGALPPDSATTINFERFLREKKPPIPKKPKG